MRGWFPTGVRHFGSCFLSSSPGRDANEISATRMPSSCAAALACCANTNDTCSSGAATAPAVENDE
eukprot:7391732-Prymnesium_polylepis.8